jgi:hypothetical protein
VWQHTCHFSDRLIQVSEENIVKSLHSGAPGERIVGLDLGIGNVGSQGAGEHIDLKEIKKVTIGEEKFEEVHAT